MRIKTVDNGKIGLRNVDQKAIEEAAEIFPSHERGSI
jgi:hypothetical protein